MLRRIKGCIQVVMMEWNNYQTKRMLRRRATARCLGEIGVSH